MFVKVALSIPYSTPFDYLVPESLISRISIGLRVMVPFGSRKMVGAIVEIADQSLIEKLKPILSLVDQKPVYSTTMLEFTKWISSYYLCSWGEVLDAALPTALKPKLVKTVHVDHQRLRDLKLDETVRDSIMAIDGCRDSDALKRAGDNGVQRLFTDLRRKKILRSQYRLMEGAPGNLAEEWLQYRDDMGSTISVKKGSTASQLLELFRVNPAIPLRTIREQVPKSGSSIRRLILKFVLSRFSKPALAAACVTTIHDHLLLELNTEQQAAVTEISSGLNSGTYHTFLLHGVTGSGKTEIYLHAVREALRKERTVLILIPEISLTPQVVSRFRERFGGRIAVLHSGIAEGERAKQWWRIKNGSCDIVIGARSAIFAPLEKIGLIVGDEEHDTSIKQQESPYYTARDIAVKRARDHACVAILGSATPSIESYANATAGKYQLISLKHRVSQQQLPKSELIDLKTEKRQKGVFYLSSCLVDYLKANLEQGRQALIFLNRRGYAAFLSCAGCDQPVLCRNCSIALTWHQTRQRLVCHHCGYNQSYPKTCAYCGESAFRLEGVGTQRVERDLKLLFPQARFLRMDRDTVSRRGSLECHINRINNQEVDFVIGTQLISKGHDFKHIGIVCIILADMSLNIPDFRSSERSYQLISQVSGRAGRSDGNFGLALVQSYNPNHYAFQAAVKHDFTGFFLNETVLRQELQNPPFTRQILIRISHLDSQRAEEAASELACALRSGDSQTGFQLMGPIEAPLQKINNRYFWHILIKGTDMIPAKMQLKDLVFQHNGWRPKTGVRVAVDVDPMTML